MLANARLDDFRVLLIEQRQRHLASANHFLAPLFRAQVSAVMATTATDAMRKLQQRVFNFDLLMVNADFDKPFYADTTVPMPRHDELTAGETFALMAVDRDPNVKCVVVHDHKMIMPSVSLSLERTKGRIAFVSGNDARWSGWWDDGEKKLVPSSEGPVPKSAPIVIDWRKAIDLSGLVSDFDRYTQAAEAALSS